LLRLPTAGFVCLGIQVDIQRRVRHVMSEKYQYSQALARITGKHFQRIKQRLRIVLTLINGRRRGAALEQDVDRFPRRADRALDGEGYFPGNLDVLAD